VPIHWALIRDPQGRFETQALLCTDHATTPAQILGWFSLVVPLAHERMGDPTAMTWQAAWYRTPHPTFAEALALVRREFWRHESFQTSACTAEVVKLPRALVECLTDAPCYVVGTAKVAVRSLFEPSAVVSGIAIRAVPPRPDRSGRGQTIRR
jgi:hypothetical protein